MLFISYRYLFSFSGQNLVPEPPLQVQEVVEKWRNPPGAARRFERVTSLHVSANDRLGLSAHSEDEQREPHFTSEQQPAAHHRRTVVVLGQLLLVLVHELCDASAAAGAASPQLGHQRWDDILKYTNINILGSQKKTNRTILVKTDLKKIQCQYF